MTRELPDDWRLRAGCRNSEEPDLWCAARQNNESPPHLKRRLDRAKAICAGCPVKAECLADAEPGDYMIRGGLTPEERAASPRVRAPRVPSVERRRRSEALYLRVLDLAAQGVPRLAIAAEAGVHPTSVDRILRKARGAA